ASQEDVRPRRGLRSSAHHGAGRLPGPRGDGQGHADVRAPCLSPAERAGPAEREESLMIDLYDAATNTKIGSIMESDLKVLVDYLEKESTEDQDYFIDQATIDYLADGRATDHLVNLLRAAVGSSDGVEIRWERR